MLAWAEKHWFLTFVLAATAISTVGQVVKAVAAPAKALPAGNDPNLTKALGA